MQQNLNKTLERIRQFNRERDWDKFHSPKNLVMGLMVETAELAEHFLWMETTESRKLPPHKLPSIRDEIGDVLLYLINLCDKLGIDPLKAANAKLNCNQVKYPADLVRGKSLKYNEYPTPKRRVKCQPSRSRRH